MADASVSLADLRGLRSAPELDAAERESLSVALMPLLERCDWFTVGVMAPSADAAVQALRALESALGWPAHELDPAGEATRAAAGRLGVTSIQRLRIGKAVEVELEADSPGAAREQLELLSDRLLANPVIENWSLEQLETAPSEA